MPFTDEYAETDAAFAESANNRRTPAQEAEYAARAEEDFYDELDAERYDERGELTPEALLDERFSN